MQSLWFSSKERIVFVRFYNFTHIISTNGQNKENKIKTVDQNQTDYNKYMVLNYSTFTIHHSAFTIQLAISIRTMKVYK